MLRIRVCSFSLIHGALAAPFLRTARALLVVSGFAFGSLASAQTASFSYAIAALGGGFSHPNDVAVDMSGNIYVADTNDSAVKEMPAGCASSSCVTTLGGGFSSPNGVAVDGSGNVYVADTSNSAVKEMPAGCASSSCVTTLGGGFFFPYGVAVDGSGNVYVAEPLSNAVVEMPAGCASSSCVTTLGGGFEGPNSVAVDGSGNVYVSESLYTSEVVYNEVNEMPSGCTSSSCVTTLGGGFSGPTGVAVDGNGNVYVADAGNNAVKEMPAGCATSSCVTALGGGFYDPQGVAVDGSGNVYVADSNNNAVKEIMTRAADLFTVPVKTASAALTLTFTFNSAGSLSSTTPYQVLTQGATNLDFKAAATQETNACNGTTSYTTGETCTVDVTLKPAAPGVRSGAVELLGSSNNLIATGYVWGVGSGPQVTFPGAEPATYVSGLNVPLGMAVDAAGDLLIANSYGPNVWLVAPDGSTQTKGSGFVMPTAVAIDGAGNIFIADNDAVVYEIGKVSNAQTQLNIPGLTDPEYLSVDGAGNLYISEPSAHTVLKVTPSGAQSTVGTGLSDPRGTTEDGAGNVYIIDYSEGAVITVPPTGSQTAVYGLGGPTGVAVDPAGDIYVADFGNGILILITPSGAVSTIDGNAFEGPWDAGMDGSGNLYVTDYIAGVVRKIDLADPPALNFAATPVGLTSSDSPQTVMLTNSGNAPLTFPNPSAGNDPSISTNFLLNSGVGSDCPLVTSSSAAGTLAAGASCLLPISFRPTTTGSFDGTLTLTDNSLNAASPAYATQSIELSGTGTPDSPTIASVSAILPQQTQTITITGSGFGAQSAYNGDSGYILFADPSGIPPWYAGNNGSAVNQVTLAVSSWTDTQIVVTGFTGAYGTDGACLKPGDQVYFKVWNALTGNGPAYYPVTVGSSTNTCVPGPKITSVSAVLPQQTQTITITGSGFGTQSAYTGDSSDILFADPTGTAWYAGDLRNAVSLAVTSWSDTQIVLSGFTGAYGTDGMCIKPGDQVYFKVWNAQTGSGPAYYPLTAGSGTNTCVPGPTITSVSTILPQQTQTITISGSGFGTKSAYTGDSSSILVADASGTPWYAGDSGNAVKLSVSSWTDSQIVLTGFSGAYGTSAGCIRPGDQLYVKVWNAQTGSGPAYYPLTAGSGTNTCP